MGDVEVDVVTVDENRLSGVPIPELKLFRCRSGKSSQQLAQNPTGNNEPPTSNRSQRSRAVSFIGRKRAGERIVAPVAYVERGNPDLHFFGHQLKRGQRSSPPFYPQRSRVSPRSATD